MAHKIQESAWKLALSRVESSTHRRITGGVTPKPFSKKARTYSNSFKGEKYSFTEPIPEELLCPVCYELLDAPHQIMCGHLFCKRCLIKVTGKPQIEVNERVKCPVCRSEDKGVFPDRHTDRKVNNLSLKCPNPPCSWKGSLCHLEQHRNDDKGCLYEKVACPKGCDAKIPRKGLDTHQKEECPKRPEACEYCSWAGTHESMPDHHIDCVRFPICCLNNCSQSLIPRGEMGDHLEICPKARVYCSNGCGIRIIREDLLTHETNDCPKRLVKCQHCTVDMVYENMKSHHKACTKYPLPCLNNCITGIVPRKGMEEHLQTCPNQKIMCPYQNIGCSKVLPRSKIEEHKEESREQHLQLSLERVSQLTDVVSALSTKLAMIEKHLQLTDVLSTTVVPELPLSTRNRPWLRNSSLVPLMPWVARIDNFDERKRNSEMWESESIFTEINGYQIGLHVYPNGINTSSQQHVSVFCHLRSGPNDDLLSWPFRGTVKYSLLNQEENTSHKSFTVEFHYGTRCSKRVTDGSGVGIGLSRFIAQENLNSRGITYLDNDCLYFRVELIRQVP